MAWVTIVAMLALLEYFYFSIQVGQARGKYGVKAPATTGNEISSATTACIRTRWSSW